MISSPLRRFRATHRAAWSEKPSICADVGDPRPAPAGSVARYLRQRDAGPEGGAAGGEGEIRGRGREHRIGVDRGRIALERDVRVHGGDVPAERVPEVVIQ